MFRGKRDHIGLAVFTLVLLITLGVLAHSSQARQPDTKPPAKKEEAKKAAKPRPTPFQIRMRDLLESRLESYEGIDDPKATLGEALEHLTTKYLARLPQGNEFKIEVNERAFAEEALNDVRKAEVAMTPLPRMDNVTAAAILRRLLGRLPVPSGATYLLRPHGIEITTVLAVRRELRLPETKPLDLVHFDITQVPLREALRDISSQIGANVVVDARAGDSADTPITAQMTNTHLETAVRILADMAGLEVVPLGNVLYVTSHEQAKKWDAARRRACGNKEYPPVAMGAAEM